MARRLFWSCGLAALLCCSGASAQQSLHFLTESNEPESFVAADGEIYGRSVAIVRTMLEKLAQPYTMELLPWRRAYEQTKDDRTSCLFLMAKTTDRVAQFKWVGPLWVIGIELYGLPGKLPPIKTIDDIRRLDLLVGVQKDDISEIVVKRTGGIRSDAVMDNALNLQRLQAGRVDLWASGIGTGEFVRRSQGVKLATVIELDREELSIGCNPGVDDALIARMNKTLVDLRAAGAFNRPAR